MAGAGRGQEEGPAQLHLHLLTQLPYEEIEHPAIVLPERTRNPEYTRNPVPQHMYVPDLY